MFEVAPSTETTCQAYLRPSGDVPGAAAYLKRTIGEKFDREIDYRSRS